MGDITTYVADWTGVRLDQPQETDADGPADQGEPSTSFNSSI